MELFTGKLMMGDLWERTPILQEVLLCTFRHVVIYVVEGPTGAQGRWGADRARRAGKADRACRAVEGPIGPTGAQGRLGSRSVTSGQ